jgi:type II restriction enzyme
MVSDRCDIRPRWCPEEVFNNIRQSYDNYVRSSGLSFRLAIENFEEIAENSIRPIFGTGRRADQMWRSCKGFLYEYAVCKALNEVLLNDHILLQKIDIIHSSNLKSRSDLRDQVAIRNWKDVFPDVDFIIVNRVCNRVMAIVSCKTSLRERLSETAFWSRELRQRGAEVEVIFITADKDNEITEDINRYIVMHVLDYTVITDNNRYNEIISQWRRKYGDSSDFNAMIRKIINFSNIVQVLYKYAQKC